MKKQVFSNSSVRDAPKENDFLKKIEGIKSAVDFYNLKSEIISRLKEKNTECD